MGVRELALAALGVFASGCLGAPPRADEEPPPDEVDAEPASSDGGGAGPDSATVCADAFTVAYTNMLDVKPAGGLFDGVVVIAAIGDGVDLTEMVDESDDSAQFDLVLLQPSYDLLLPGQVSGELDPASAALIVGPLVDSEAWIFPATPSFRLDFAERPSEAPPPHHATAQLRIGNSVAMLDFDLTYVPGQNKVAIPRKAALALSVCDN